MSEEQINKLKEKIAGGEVYFCFYRRYWKIVGILREWVEYEGAPPEPAVALDDGTFAALWTSEPDQFVEMRPVL